VRDGCCQPDFWGHSLRSPVCQCVRNMLNYSYLWANAYPFGHPAFGALRPEPGHARRTVAAYDCGQQLFALLVLGCENHLLAAYPYGYVGRGH
jgi:hypothetical protein